MLIDQDSHLVLSGGQFGFASKPGGAVSGDWRGDEDWILPDAIVGIDSADTGGPAFC